MKVWRPDNLMLRQKYLHPCAELKISKYTLSSILGCHAYLNSYSWSPVSKLNYYHYILGVMHHLISRILFHVCDSSVEWQWEFVRSASAFLTTTNVRCRNKPALVPKDGRNYATWMEHFKHEEILQRESIGVVLYCSCCRGSLVLMRGWGDMDET